METNKKTYSGLIFVSIKIFAVLFGIVLLILYRFAFSFPGYELAYFVLDYVGYETIWLAFPFCLCFWFFGRFANKSKRKKLFATICFLVLDLILLMVFVVCTGGV